MKELFYTDRPGEEAHQKLSQLVAGKTVATVARDDEHMDDRLVITFTDGSVMTAEYDWLYSLKLEEQ